MAQAKDGDKYIGFTFGRSTLIVLDSTMVLIEPMPPPLTMKSKKPHKNLSSRLHRQFMIQAPTSVTARNARSSRHAPRAAAVGPLKRRFYASVQLDPIVAKKQFSDIVDEVLLQFTSRPERHGASRNRHSSRVTRGI